MGVKLSRCGCIIIKIIEL